MRRQRFTRRERWPTSHYHPHENLVVRYRRKEYELESGHGSNDEVVAYRDGHQVYVVSRDTRHPYVGIAVYDLGDVASGKQQANGRELYDSIDHTWDMFLQGTEQVEDCLGKRGDDKSAWWIVRRMLQWME